LEETVFPEMAESIRKKIAFETARLIFHHPQFIPEWEILINEYNPDKIQLASERFERTRTRSIIDSLIFFAFELKENEVEKIIENNPDNPTGFFRVDRDIPVEQRQTTLTMEAFKHLKRVGLERFLEEDWKLPDYVTEVDPPGIKIWEPVRGWEKTWAESRALLTEEEWKEFTGETLSGDGTSDSGKEEKSAQQGLF
jgi:hypothetical protein